MKTKAFTLVESNVTDMSGMFAAASGFNGDISSWNVSNVKNMGEIFNYAIRFNQDLSSWNVSNVIKKTSFYLGAYSWTKPKPNF